MSFENQRENTAGEFVCVVHGSPVCEECAYERGKMDERERCTKLVEGYTASLTEALAKGIRRP